MTNWCGYIREVLSTRLEVALCQYDQLLAYLVSYENEPGVTIRTYSALKIKK